MRKPKRPQDRPRGRPTPGAGEVRTSTTGSADAAPRARAPAPTHVRPHVHAHAGPHLAPGEHAHVVAHGQGRRARHALVVGCLLLLATGVAWLAGHDLWLQQTPYGAQPYPFVAWLLRAHGAIAWGTAVIGGVVWQVHVRPAWRAVRRRRAHAHRLAGQPVPRHARARTVSGVGLVAALALLLGSAIGLQYAPEEAHGALSVVHWATGLVLAAGLLWHWLARLRRPRG